ncbi:succinyl-diaminopimelate desuccinylase [Corynebacterium alimapuense]|uniref:Succinyl-diaminopimelate desuccinylase n=1 Tax=Corynebacterium alimapuense TaxID=1576874 RepID=A0A3M8K624_9CORY|nr:succinyl-diaminopimelate desuccinylase [Corynebacterium alimapuense]RNE48677.1 succinyl-diaminopimelate desuccinylase [Corynebacterium alimapuense]
MRLDLTSDPVDLTAALVDIPSPSHHEQEIADTVEHALHGLSGVEVIRHGNTVAARTNRGLGSRVILAGHTDTVPVADNLPHRLSEGVMHGCGTVDMKSGMAVYLHNFAVLAQSPELAHDLTVIAYDCEEVDGRFNGLGQLAAAHPEWVHGDLALLGEPSGAMIEAGCQGSLRVRVTATGVRAHSARSWLGDNAAHKLAAVIGRIADYQPREVDIDGCLYREGINVVKLESFVATNSIPDEASMLVNYRFAPDRTGPDAQQHLQEVLDLGADMTLEVDDLALAALPGLHQPAAAALVKAVGGNVRAKFGWTDVSRFAELGIPAVNFGPGDPGFAHKRDEQLPVDQVGLVSDQLHKFLVSQPE